jgi:serine/threonine protein kinase
MPRVPTRIDRYEIKGRLGSGGMGAVYLARDTNPTTDRLVVLKLLRSSFDSDEPRRRFAREAQALAGLNHPNIVVIYDSGEYDDSPFIVMEYVRGETLAESIRRKAPMPLGVKLGLLSELCAGLAHAHEDGIVHRDIKPANLVVDLNGRLKILDFGIARLDADATARDGQLTLATVRIGTPGYMSPEQLETGEVDARSDVFAVGAVAYELISGHEAFTGATTTQIERKVIGEQPAPLVSAVPGLDPAIAAIITSALEKDVRQRCQSAAELGEAFDRVRERLPETGRPPRPTPQPPRASSEKKPRRERAADQAYERAVTSYRDGAEDCARRFAMEAIAEYPEHVGARHLLLELGRFRDVEPWLPAAPATPAAPPAGDWAATAITPLPPRPPAFPPIAPPVASPDSGTMVAPPVALDSSATLIAQPAPEFDDSETLIAPGMVLRSPEPPRPARPPESSPPAPPPSVPASARPAPKSAQPASGPRGSSTPALRRVLIGVGVLGLLLVVAAAAWFLWPSGPSQQASTTTPPAGGPAEGAGAVREGPPPAAPTQQLLTIDVPTGGTVEGPGIRCGTGGADCAVNQPAGVDATLAARPDPGFTFGGFTGDCSSAGVISMTEPRRCGATFTKAAPRALQADRAPQADRARRGAGAAVDQPRPPTPIAPTPAPPVISTILTVARPTDGTVIGNGIECGPAIVHCTSRQPTGASVRLMARPKPGFVFTGFTDDCDAGGLVVMTTARACGATFAKADSRLPAASFPTLTVTRPRNGTIVGPGIECGTGGSRCKAQQPAGSTALLRVQPDPGFFFIRFTGDCDAGGLAVMSGPKQCAVSILSLKDEVPNEVGYPTLTITRPTGGTVIGNGIECGSSGAACSARQPAARQVRLLALPDVGFVFVRFTGDCDESGVMMMNAPRTCTATFAKGGQ